MTLLGLSYFYCYQQLKEIVGDILKKNLVTALCNFEKLQEQFLAIEFFRRLSVISRTAFVEITLYWTLGTKVVPFS